MPPFPDSELHPGKRVAAQEERVEHYHYCMSSSRKESKDSVFYTYQRIQRTRVYRGHTPFTKAPQKIGKK